MYERALAGSAVRSRWAVDSRGARVHLVERGSQASGPPAVLLHGTTACAGFFVPMLAELDGLHVVAADRPGQGLSDPIELPRAQFRESAVAWTDRLLDTLELRSTALVGHSGGALWALWYALAASRPGRPSGALRPARDSRDPLPRAAARDGHALASARC